MKKFICVLFYGNIFYSLCAVALCFETSLQHNVAINRFPFYLLIFFCTWLYYTRIYYKSTSAKFPDARTVFYKNNKKQFKSLIAIVTLLVVGFIIILLVYYFDSIKVLRLTQWALILTFPAVAALYTLPLPYLKKIREVSWLKPFVISFTWSGLVTVYPIIVAQIQNVDKEVPFPSFLYFANNFLFISVLAIIFDIKDYHSDKVHQLKTYPTQLGIQRTIWWVIVPIIVINLVVLASFHITMNNGGKSIALQAIPFLLLILILTQLPRLKQVLHYLVFVDGLMLVKALLGIISVTILKSK